MPIATVKELCKPSSIASSDGLVEQVAQLEDFSTGKIDAAEFFQRNYFTEGLRRLVERGFQRLAGKSDDGAYYLTQAMGGGKTHSLIAFGLLAADPAIRTKVMPKIDVGAEFGAAKVVIFNGHQNPENLFWGFIAEKLGRPEVMASYWKGGAKRPGVDQWVEAIGDEPTLILVDELPSYLQMAQGEPVGNTTLGELTIGALETLFNALPRCPRACVVVTNLKDDVYLEGSGKLRTLIENLTKHYDRNAQAITPVQQNTGEVFEIVRKRLFDKLPDGDRIYDVAQAYVDALQKAKRVDSIAATPEAFVERVRETYPFHPSIRDIVARFSENRGYQKTRAFIRLLRLAVKGAFDSEQSTFLIGLQHLDFNDQATIEEIRKINGGYINAISHDVADRGQALSEKIDRADGATTTSSVSKVLLMSSLSSAETPLRGLTEGELIETLIDPLLEVSEIKSSLTKFSDQAWYLFKGVDQRVFFGQTANVTAEITEIARNIADEHVDEALRQKLKEVFQPKSNRLYSDRMAILPALDEIELDDERPTLIILERPAEKLPKDFDDWWNNRDLQNRVLVLTADPNAVETLKTSARRMRAVDKVEERLRAQANTTTQMEELQNVKARESAGFTSALRETFKTLVFPTKNKLRMIDDFRMEFDRNDYSGEEQIVDLLTRRGKYIPAEKFETEFENLRLEAQDILFDADSMQLSSLKRNAAARPAWFWLPRNGLDELVKRCVQRGHWRDQDGLIAKKWERRTRVTARLDDFGPNAFETGRFIINVTAEEADTIYFAKDGPPDPRIAEKLDGRVYETDAPAVWFLAIDSSGKATTGDPYEWRAPIRLRMNVKSLSDGCRIDFAVSPRAAKVRASFDGSDPKLASYVELEVDAPAGTTQIRAVAEIDGQFSEEESANLAGGMRDVSRPYGEDKQKLDLDASASLTSRFEPRDTALVFKALDHLAKTPGVVIRGAILDAKDSAHEQAYLSLRAGKEVALPATELEKFAKGIIEQLTSAAPIVSLRIDGIDFPSGRELRRFCDVAELDFERIVWRQI